MCHLFAEPHLSHHYRRVLVVDDYADSADALCMFLEAAAFEVRACYGGLSAIEVAREFAPSVILLDIAMAGMSGFQVLQCLRADPQTMHAAIVAYTAQYCEADVDAYRTAGFDGWCEKPSDSTRLARLAEPGL